MTSNTDDDPTLVPADPQRFHELYEDEVENKPWTDIIMRPRLYWATKDDGGRKVVVNKGWFTDRMGSLYGFLERVFGVRLGLQAALAHEYGHTVLDLDHPDEFPDKYLDVMGFPSLRTRDRHNVMERSKEWRDDQTDTGTGPGA